jgi:hypothetical protein
MIYAPWTEEQVKALNRWQEAGYVHPFTCWEGDDLVATTGGWVCPKCSYQQNWAHSFMLEEPVNPMTVV